MKRIIEQKSFVLGDDSFENNVVSISPPVVSVPEEIIIPPKVLFNSNLKELNGFRDLRKQLKLKKLEAEFIFETSKVLSLFHNDDKKYDSQCVAYVAQLAEDYFISHPKLGEIKERAVIESVKQYYNLDEKLVKSIIALVLPVIKKSTTYRRISNAVVFFLSRIVCDLLGK